MKPRPIKITIEGDFHRNSYRIIKIENAVSVKINGAEVGVNSCPTKHMVESLVTCYAVTVIGVKEVWTTPLTRS